MRLRPLPTWLLVAGIALVAVNLRPAVASVGPVLDDIGRNLGLSGAGTSLLTTVPVACFGVLAPLAPRLERRVGAHRTVGLLLFATAAGLLVRVTAGTATLFAGTVVAAGAIAVGNVLVPALVKRDFPDHVGPMMGIYTTFLTGAAAVAAGTTVPLGQAIGHGWRGALGVWLLPALLALLVWSPQLPAGDRPPQVAARGAEPGSLLRDRTAWWVTCFFGLQSLSFYAVLSWLPSIYRDHGYSATSAGALLSFSAAVQVPMALAMPLIATRMRGQRAVAAGCTLLTAGGLLGIMLLPTTATYLWVVVLGLGQGGSFPVALTFLVVRTTDSRTTAQLSAMAQTVGYVIAAAGPLAVGALHDALDSWTAPLLLLIGLAIPQLIAGVLAGRPHYVLSR